MGRALHRRGVTADLLTATGLVTASATAVAAALGHFHLAIVLLIVTGAHDLLDGPVAKAAGTASVRGAFFDSVTDRVTDALLMGGVAWYLVSAHEGHLALLPLAVLGVTALVSYERAKAEALGLSARGGLMERAERLILLGVGFVATWLLLPVLWTLLGLVTLTAVDRFVRVWQLASRPRPEPGAVGRRAPRWSQRRVESRWRLWREGGVARPVFGRTGEPLGRWRARRQEALASRSGRARRARRPTRVGPAGPGRNARDSSRS